MEFIPKYRLTRTIPGLFLVVFLIAPATESSAQIPSRTLRSVRPPDLNVQFHRAETAWKSGNSLLEAKARIDRVIEALPDDVEARKLRAGIYLSMERPENALIDARAAARLATFDGEAHLLVCESAVRTNRNRMASEALYLSSDLLLDRPDLHIRLSRCAVDLGLLDDAEAYARIALATHDMSAAAYMQLARVFVFARQTQKAITVLERGLKLGLVKPGQIRRDNDLKEVAKSEVLSSLMRAR